MGLHPIILSGGSGTRLWPLSREYLPKQFLSLLGTDTLFQSTLRRLDGFSGVAETIIVCNEEHRFLVSDQMNDINSVPLEIITEPVGRNTAPALTLAALSLESRYVDDGVDPVMAVMPADHVVIDRVAFMEAMKEGERLAETGLVVTLGVIPSNPSSAYGYIQSGDFIEAENICTAREVKCFVEKPRKDIAEGYISSADWCWNSGIFIVKVSVWLSELARHRPDIEESCRKAMRSGSSDGVFYRPEEASFSNCPEDSIDYAVMERIGDEKDVHSVVIPIDVGWSDVGSWSVIWEVQDKDLHGNVIKGDVYTNSTENSLLVAQNRLLATVGVSDLVVVDTPDAILVADKNHVQSIKDIVQNLRRDSRSESINHSRVNRPWGSYEIIDAGFGFQVKRLNVKVGASLSLQKHKYRAEHWIVVNGTATVTKGDEQLVISENGYINIPVGELHRIENFGENPVEIIEIQTGSYLGEDDIVRYEDKYGRDGRN